MESSLTFGTQTQTIRLHGLMMDRLQKKCALASAGLHLLLALILIFNFNCSAQQP